ncbi:MAG: DUF2529 family protein [Armatimonadetes bacterium]|nr:DUF2529 family protein [Armatimonadota bacterium]
MDRREFARVAAALAAGAGLVRIATADGPGAMRRYLTRIRRDLARVQAEQLDVIVAAGDLLAERVAAGGRLLIHDARGEYVAEALGRAGGLMGISAVGADQAATIQPQDALLVIADEPANPADVALTTAAHAAGALVVGICPQRDRAGALWQAVYVRIDNYVTDEDAAVTVDGVAMAPTSGVLNTALLWAVTAAYIQAMEKRGKPPHVWMSIKRPGSKAFNDAALAATREAGC